MTALSRRSTFVVVVVMALFAACQPGEVAGPPPELTPEQEAALAGNALERACGGQCDGLTLYLKQSMIGGRPVHQSTVEEFRGRFDDVIVVSHQEAAALIGDDALVDGGDGVLVTVAPADDLAPNVIGIQIDLQRALDGGRGKILLFQWDGEEWIPATSEDTGVPVTSWVS